MFARSSPSTVVHTAHNSSIQVTPSQEPFHEYLKSTCPSLSTGFKPTPWLFNGHLQTIFSTLQTDRHPLTFQRRLITHPDGGCSACDIYPPDSTCENAPVLVILHGLTGGSQESYIQSLIHHVTSSSGEPGQFRFTCVVVHARGCNGSPVNTPHLFSARFTQDLHRCMQAFVTNMFPQSAFIVMMGFSLGANILINYLSDLHHYDAGENEQTLIMAKLRGAVSIGNPYDLLLTNRHLRRTAFNRWVYDRTLGSNLVRLFKHHCNVFRDVLDVDWILQATNSTEYDERCTRRAFGYPTVDAYFRDAGCAQRLMDVRVPLVCLTALDDPVAPSEAVPWDECLRNPYVQLVTTMKGGHLAWFEGIWRTRRWSSRVLAEIAQSLGQVSVLMMLGELLYVCVDGFGASASVILCRSKAGAGAVCATA